MTTEVLALGGKVHQIRRNAELFILPWKNFYSMFVWLIYFRGLWCPLLAQNADLRVLTNGTTPPSQLPESAASQAQELYFWPVLEELKLVQRWGLSPAPLVWQLVQHSAQLAVP